MKGLLRKSVLAAFCLLSLPTAAFADAAIIGPCGNGNTVGNATLTFNCVFNGANVQYGGSGTAGVNFSSNVHSPVMITGVAGQETTVIMRVQTSPQWTVAGLVSTRLTLTGSVAINAPGATVDVLFTGLLGGRPIPGIPGIAISHLFNANTPNFTMTITGDQFIANVASSALIVVIKGDATFSSPGSGEFIAEVPEPTALLLFGTGLAGVAFNMRKRLKNRKSG